MAEVNEPGGHSDGDPDGDMDPDVPDSVVPAGISASLATDAVWAEVDEGVLDRILIEIGESPATEPVGTLAEVGRPRWSRNPMLVAAAVALFVVAAVGVIAGVRSRTDGDVTTVAMAATELAPGASGTARVRPTGSGVEITLDLQGLAPAPEGFYYQAWVKGPRGLVTIGTFHARRDARNIDLWSGVDLADYPTITVTLQREGDGAESSGQVVLKGEVRPPGESLDGAAAQGSPL